MCLSRNNIGGAGDKLDGPIGHGVVHDDLAHSENPSAEQFRMLLNLLPPQSIAQVRDLDSIRWVSTLITPTCDNMVSCNIKFYKILKNERLSV